MKFIKICKMTIDGLNYSNSDEFYWDSDIKGFAVKITKTKKTFVVQSRVNGRTIRKNIGSCSVFTPDEARKLAKKFLGEMAQGIDINYREKVSNAKNTTLQMAFDEYIAIKNITESTKTKYKRSMRLRFNDWKDKPIPSITREMIEARFIEASKSSKSIANSDFRFLRALLNFAIEKYIIRLMFSSRII